MTEAEKKALRKLLNNLNIGTAKAKLGDKLIAHIDALEARVKALEDAAA